ncbi:MULTISPECIES: hypothetical protein [unclassified Pseudonocardia]|nr:hypothetical protein [Pseudonocardia sp. Ae707_Ps1]OLM09250.1 hypothetical protein Ae707Ps1_6197 [Pseudonocardia sp. Ae707_Ps1]
MTVLTPSPGIEVSERSKQVGLHLGLELGGQIVSFGVDAMQLRRLH